MRGKAKEYNRHLPLPKEERFRAGPFLYFTANIYDDGGGDGMLKKRKREYSLLEKRLKHLALGKQQHSSTLPITAAPKKR